jgi:two-component system, chemotaxis family, chemotaxis protein CheY
MHHILAVDDSRAMREMVSLTLRDAGFQVSCAGDGVEALALAKREHFTLVITDINMPEMDGFSLIRALRALPEYRHIPILTLTTEGSPEQKQEGRAAGATGWMIKPFDPERLLATLRRVLP